jgi:two-component system, OmpR family, response regulator
MQATLPLVSSGDSVLVVDDDAGMRQLVATLLRGRAGAVTVVGSVAEAVDVLERVDVDVIVSDHSMPRATGLNLLAFVRARGLDVRFVLASAAAPPGVAEAAREAGADFVTKAQLVDLLSYAVAA